MFPLRKRDPQSAIAPPIPATLRVIGVIAAFALSVGAGRHLAARTQSDPIVITLPTPERPANAPRRGGGFAPASTSQESNCRGPSPGPSWTCVNGTWTTGATPGTAGTTTSASSTSSSSSSSSASSNGSVGNTGGGGGGGVNGCLTAQPGPSFRCQSGVWTFGTSAAGPTGATGPGLEAPRTEDPARATLPTATTPPASTGAPAACAGPPPVAPLGASVSCVGGSWVVR